MTRRLDIGPVLLVVGAAVLVVALFLRWYGPLDAWAAFELVDLLLAALAVATGAIALAMLLPEADYLDRRALPWIVVAAFAIVAVQLLNPPPAAGSGAKLGTGAWLALAATVAMIAGAVLSLGRVSFAVKVEGRDRRRRVAAVDHQQPTGTHERVAPPPGGPVSPSSETLLRRRERDEEPPES